MGLFSGIKLTSMFLDLVFAVCFSVPPVSSWSLLCMQKLDYYPE